MSTVRMVALHSREAIVERLAFEQARLAAVVEQHARLNGSGKQMQLRALATRRGHLVSRIAYLERLLSDHDASREHAAKRELAREWLG